MARVKTIRRGERRPALYFRVPVPLHGKLKKIAETEGISVSEAARMVLRAALTKDAA